MTAREIHLQAVDWNLDAERSRLHRLRVESRRLEALCDLRLAEQDARLYRCAGCGDWRYRHTSQPVRCPVCRELGRESSLGVAA